VGKGGRVSWLLDRYIRTRAPASVDEIGVTLWNDDPGVLWANREDAYLAAVLEQYKVCVEMADRTSARRGLANAFFLTLNTVVSSAIGVFWQRPPGGSAWLAVVPLVVLLGECLAWFWTLRSYRQLNAAKYAVVGALERRLPASPNWAAEWTALGGGSDPARYWPLSYVEQWIPLLFATAYLFGFLALVLG
jgi:hypothetical protein